MQRMQCRDCQGTELYDTVLSAHNGVIIGRRTRSGDEWILVRCTVCLSCGNIMPYLTEEGVAHLRTWAYQGDNPTHYPVAERAAAPPQGTQGASSSPGAGPDHPPESSDSNPAPKQDSQGFGTVVIFCLIVGVLLGIAVVVYGITHE